MIFQCQKIYILSFVSTKYIFVVTDYIIPAPSLSATWGYGFENYMISQITLKSRFSQKIYIFEFRVDILNLSSFTGYF